MNLDDIVNRAIPIEPKDCKIKKAYKEGLRLQTKRDFIHLITQNFIPKPDVKENSQSR